LGLLESTVCGILRGMRKGLRYLLGILLITAMATTVGLYYRANFETTKRFRVVSPGKFYRCAILDADGLRRVISEHKIKTVINLMHENPDPLLPQNFWNKKPLETESAVCAEAGADFRLLTFDAFPRELPPGQRPQVIDNYLKLLDDPAIYPVLIHCAAGLHRTGELTAIYRMEYEGWSKAAATREMRGNGFGDYACTTADDMVYNMVEKYQPRPPASKIIPQETTR
jgi:tyrosine-protein phosphatase SIW14